MYQLLIVDDERRVREGLSEKVNWSALGVEPCALADDGDTALPLLKRYRPDILLTDVRMRRMGGLELCTQARQLLPDLEVVFISGYSDSDYIRQALRLEAVDYVYKPIELQEVENVLRRVVGKLDERSRKAHEHQYTQELLKKSLPLLQERFLNDWFQGLLEGEHDVAQQLERLQLPFRAGQPMMPVAFSIDQSPMDERVAQQVLCEALRCQNADALICCSGREVSALLPLSSSADSSALAVQLEKLHHNLLSQQNILIAAGAGSTISQINEVPSGLLAARAALRHRFFMEAGSVVFLNNDEWRTNRRLPLKLPALLEKHLRTGKEKALIRCIQDELQKAREGQQIEHTRMLFVKIALALDEALESCGAEGDLACNFCRKALETGTFAHLQEQLWQLVHEACTRVEHLQADRNLSIRDAVRAIIEKHLGEKLTIERIAQELHYSPTYLCLLYKQETGETIGDALASSRILEAMRLLRETDEKISRIAELVGYPEQAHFARLFKKTTGITPSDYRRANNR